MEYKNHLKERLSKLIFLEINKKFLEESLNLEGLQELKEDLFLPLSPEYIADNITKDLTKELPFGEFVKGMYFVMGADRSFEQKELYRKILISLKRDSVIKGLVVKLLKDEQSEEALIYLLGLYHVHEEDEVLLNALSILEEISLKKEMYQDALLEYAEEAIGRNLTEGYLFKGSVLRLKGNFEGALTNLRDYVRLGGEEIPEITLEIEFLDRKVRILEGEEILYENPKHFLELILPILSREEDNPRLLLMIGIAYRLLENHEKAVYYLNEALAIDNAYVDVLNELGINYAAIGDYPKAINYFHALFEQIRTIEILTNLIMCYINVGDYKAAQDHIAIAELMDSDDKILIQIKKHMENLKENQNKNPLS